MFVIGELINGMYAKVAAAIRSKDADTIRALARDQAAAGANALDVNVGPASADPVRDMVWLVTTIRSGLNIPLCLDNTKPAVIEEGLKISGPGSIINSSNADPERLRMAMAMAKRYKASLIALTMDAKGVPQDRERRLEMASVILETAAETGFSVQDLWIDPVLMPIHVAQPQLCGILGLLSDLKGLAAPAPRTVVGLSNISQGAQERRLINRTFLVMAVAGGLEAAIMDPLDTELMAALTTAEMILNKKIYCDSIRKTGR
jgi:5-methyltetrahydrofolate corrinoid/iron sulfur protein methyltransferase